MRKYNENPKNVPRLRPKPNQDSTLDPLGGLTAPPKLPADYNDRFLKIVIKNNQLIFPYFDHCFKSSLLP